MTTLIFECEHENEPHTLWYWVDANGFYNVPAPYAIYFDNREDAMRVYMNMISSPGEDLRWIKIFRSDNETYTCLRWHNTKKAHDANETQLLFIQIPPKKKWWRFWERS